mgnify:CR=1 FL=1
MIKPGTPGIAETYAEHGISPLPRQSHKREVKEMGVELIKIDGNLIRCTVIGKCIACGSPVIMLDHEYGCRDGYSSPWPAWDDMRQLCLFDIQRDELKSVGKPDVTPDEMRRLLKGESIWLEKLRGKDGSVFNGYGMLEVDDNEHWWIRIVRSAR